MRRAAWLLLLLNAALASAACVAPAASAPSSQAGMPAAADTPTADLATLAPAAAIATLAPNVVADLPASTAVASGVAAPTPAPTATPTPLSTTTVSPAFRATDAPTATPDPFPVTNTAPLPPCDYQDLPTLVSPVWAWDLVLVDKAYSVGKEFVPPDLVPVRFAGFRENYQVRGLLVDDLRAMRDAASRAGAGLAIVSAYRGYREQIWSFNHWLRVLGPIAVMSSARPGHSEHQLGLAIDFRAAGGSMPWNFRDWSKETAAGAWMAQNAWKFGFVMSYPLKKADQVCYGYEPWHYRYVGRGEAAAMHASGETSRAWLWRHQPQQPLPPTPAPPRTLGPAT